MFVHRLIVEERLLRLGRPGVAGLALCVLALTLFAAGLWPALAEREGLRAQWRAASALPPEGAPRGAAAPQLALPAQDEATAAIERVFAAAQAQGLVPELGEYVLDFDAGGALARYQLRLPVAGTYPQLRAFLAHCQRALPMLGLEEVEFRRDSVAEARVEASIRMSLYLARAP